MMERATAEQSAFFRANRRCQRAKIHELVEFKIVGVFRFKTLARSVGAKQRSSWHAIRSADERINMNR
jgi:hypothetical protein